MKKRYYLLFLFLINFILKIHCESLSDYKEELHEINFDKEWYLWKYDIKKHETSLKVIELHFPELLELLKVIRDTKTMNEEVFEVLKSFSDETKEWHNSLNTNTLSKNSEEYSRIIICLLVDAYNPQIRSQEKKALEKAREKVEAKKIRDSYIYVVKISVMNIIAAKAIPYVWDKIFPKQP